MLRKKQKWDHIKCSIKTTEDKKCGSQIKKQKNKGKK